MKQKILNYGSLIPKKTQNLVFPCVSIPIFDSLCIAPIHLNRSCFEGIKSRALTLAKLQLLSFLGYNIDLVYRVPHFVHPGETLTSTDFSQFAVGKGANLKSLQDKFPEVEVLLTLGDRGVYYQKGQRLLFQQSEKVHVVDTTAAGDTTWQLFFPKSRYKKPLSGPLKERLYV